MTTEEAKNLNIGDAVKYTDSKGKMHIGWINNPDLYVEIETNYSQKILVPITMLEQIKNIE